MLTTATDDTSASLSVTVNDKLSMPKKLALGVYVKLGAVPANTPFDGELVSSKLIILPSTSEPESVTAVEESSTTFTVCIFAMGASLTAFTVTLTEAVFETPPWSSVAE